MMVKMFSYYIGERLKLERETECDVVPGTCDWHKGRVVGAQDEFMV